MSVSLPSRNYSLRGIIAQATLLPIGLASITDTLLLFSQPIMPLLILTRQPKSNILPIKCPCSVSYNCPSTANHSGNFGKSTPIKNLNTLLAHAFPNEFELLPTPKAGVWLSSQLSSHGRTGTMTGLTDPLARMYDFWIRKPTARDRWKSLLE